MPEFVIPKCANDFETLISLIRELFFAYCELVDMWVAAHFPFTFICFHVIWDDILSSLGQIFVSYLNFSDKEQTALSFE